MDYVTEAKFILIFKDYLKMFFVLFKSYGIIAEWGDFAYWWSCSEEGFILKSHITTSFNDNESYVVTTRNT